MCLRIYRITQYETKEVAAALHILRESFPLCERRTDEAFITLLATEPRYHLEVITLEHAVVGVLGWWDCDGMLRYVEHLALAAHARSRGIGRDCMLRFIARNNVPLLLEVEPPMTAYPERARRIAFYQRLGLHYEETEYWQPAYHHHTSRIRMRLMITAQADAAFLTTYFMTHCHPYIYPSLCNLSSHTIKKR